MTTIAHHPIKEVKSLALDANGNYCFVWKESSGRTIYSKSRSSIIYGNISLPDLNCEESSGLEANYPHLEPWLEKADKHHCKATFGPTIGEYFAWNNHGRWKWHGHGLEGLTHRLKDDKQTCHIKQVTLGLHKSYFVLFTNGEWTNACNASYPELHKIIHTCRRGDIAVGWHQSMSLSRD